MSTFYINLKTADLSVQSLSDVSDTKPECVEIAFDLEVVNDSPVLTDDIKNSLSFKEAVARALRDSILLTTIWISERHLSQPVDVKTLTDVEYLDWQIFWQDLRDLPTVVMPALLTDLLTILPAQPALV